MGLSKSFFLVAIIVIGFLPLASSQQSSMATQLIRVQKGLKENHIFLKTIGSTISNTGNEDDKNLYKRAILFQIESEILQLQLDLGKSYSGLRRTQSLLIQLYYQVLDRSIPQVEDSLNRIAQISNRKELTQTRNYLGLGYRDLAVAKNSLLLAKNTRPWLYSIKLVDLMNSLHHLKQAQKYYINLAILHEGEISSDPDSTTSFESKKKEIQRVLPSRSESFLKIHYDSYFLPFDSVDLFDKFWQEADLTELAKPLDGYDPAYTRHDPPWEPPKPE